MRLTSVLVVFLFCVGACSREPDAGATRLTGDSYAHAGLVERAASDEDLRNASHHRVVPFATQWFPDADYRSARLIGDSAAVALSSDGSTLIVVRAGGGAPARRVLDGSATDIVGGTAVTAVVTTGKYRHLVLRPSGARETIEQPGTALGMTERGVLLTRVMNARVLAGVARELEPIDLYLGGTIIFSGGIQRDPVLGRTPWSRVTRAIVDDQGGIWVSPDGRPVLVHFADPAGTPEMLAWRDADTTASAAEVEAYRAAQQEFLLTRASASAAMEAEALKALSPGAPVPVIDRMIAGVRGEVCVMKRVLLHLSEDDRQWNCFRDDRPSRRLTVPPSLDLLDVGDSLAIVRFRTADSRIGLARLSPQ